MKRLLLGALLISLSFPSFAQKQSKPNIILVMVDDMGYGAPSTSTFSSQSLKKYP